MTEVKVDKSFNKQRRRVLQGVGAVAATSMAPTVFGVSEASVSVSGTVVSKIGAPVKTLLLRNNSIQAVKINEFANSGLMFDGEVVDCNGACLEQAVSLAPGEEKLVQFDKRRLFNKSPEKVGLINVQSKVSRLHEGTRIVPFEATVIDGVAKL